MNNLSFPLLYTPFVTEGLLKFLIFDSQMELIASSENEEASVLFVEIANQSHNLPNIPNIKTEF
ncbi:hypothetical protein [Nostoc sp. ChiQUE01b]|uniref:hypothetical protein n=1 Tax=Nostoc sp. ChiQUE01b TaxID=3075376 RepID=UPI002AD36AC7|nr:hypothetical protein [Nostoc sp. ChiQUE01b]MDZ8237663.1 hypothetical protein [Nostoc sp. ChiQUE01a]MDZ8264337.1 hypothetical protein [Nostoc sp. ChiQUE01b]